MAKAASVWECQQCGSQFPKWAGKCPDCGKWNTLVETAVSPSEGRRKKAEGRRRAGAASPQKLSDILKNINTIGQRISTGIGELDRVLGGGLVPGQVVLLAGEPGMGKSTLLSQVAIQLGSSLQKMEETQEIGKTVEQYNSEAVIGKTVNGRTVNRRTDLPAYRPTDYRSTVSPFHRSTGVLYVCGEESPSQVALRLRRLSSPLTVHDSRLSLYPETDVDAVVTIMSNEQKTMSNETGIGLVIIDSIQTMATGDLSGLAGSVGQIRESTGRLSQVAKSLNIPLFLVGHVTKEGEVAGPKVLEHMVDTVLVMEGDRSGNLRILRSLKNRFGPVDEVGIFSMDDGGMREVPNPAELLIGDLAAKAPGSVLGCVLEGQRPLVLEIQALAVPTKLSFPRRVGQGISERRLQLLCAVIEKHLGLGIGEKDVFVNVAGGLKSSDSGIDLPVVAAIVSSLLQETKGIGKTVKQYDSGTVIGKTVTGKPVNRSTILPDYRSTEYRPTVSLSHRSTDVPIFSGEVGLLGEVRMIPGWPRREKEVNRLGLGKLVGKAEIKHIGELRKFL